MFPFLPHSCLDQEFPVRDDDAADVAKLVGSESAASSDRERIYPTLGFPPCLGDMNMRPLIEVGLLESKRIPRDAKHDGRAHSIPCLWTCGNRRPGSGKRIYRLLRAAQLYR
jgi:hypothetical protein